MSTPERRFGQAQALAFDEMYMEEGISVYEASAAGGGVRSHANGDGPSPAGVPGELRPAAELDPLTGLCNRPRFDRELRIHLDRLTEQGASPSALLLVDVDAFRFVNDSLGHEAGDRVLREIGARLVSESRKADLLARIGGDEFALLLTEASQHDALAVARRVIRAVKAEAGAGISVSIGIAMFDGTHGDLDASELLIAADIALFNAKEGGRGQAILYSGGRGPGLTSVERIREAIEEERIVVFQQPIIDLKTGKVDRDELLARMCDRDGNVLAPESFLPTAERFGLVEEIDRLVLRKAIELAGHSRPMAINLSGPTLSSNRLLEDVAAAIHDGLDPSWLDFEITETAAIANMEQARDFARALTELGCRLGLDDFGTGFSSFTYLKYLPVDYIKIDVEFVHDICSSAFDQQVVQAIVDIAHALEIETVAEGVEDSSAMAIVQGLGVDYAQGFYLSRPDVVTEPAAAVGARRAP